MSRFPRSLEHPEPRASGDRDQVPDESELDDAPDAPPDEEPDGQPDPGLADEDE